MLKGPALLSSHQLSEDAITTHVGEGEVGEGEVVNVEVTEDSTDVTIVEPSNGGE
jgi:hypothetical protein